MHRPSIFRSKPKKAGRDNFQGSGYTLPATQTETVQEPVVPEPMAVEQFADTPEPVLATPEPQKAGIIIQDLQRGGKVNTAFAPVGCRIRLGGPVVIGVVRPETMMKRETAAPNPAQAANEKKNLASPISIEIAKLNDEAEVEEACAPIGCDVELVSLYIGRH